MLQKLNERVQGVVAWVIVILIAIAFTVFGIDYYMQSRQNTNDIAMVNGQPISKEAFELSYRRARNQYDPEQMTGARDKQLKKQVEHDMVVNSVMVQAARHNGFEVTPAQANGAIINIPQFQEEGHFSADKYQQALSGAYFTPDTFQNEVRQGMLLNQQRFSYIGTAFALPNEIERFVKLYMQTRDYQYILIPAASFHKDITVSDADIAQYYNQHKQDFLSPEMVSVDYILLSLQAIKKHTQVTEEQAHTYYQENQSNYTHPAQWKVAHILFSAAPDAPIDAQKKAKEKAFKVYAEIKQNPATFEKKLLLSDDKISAMKQGELPWITAGESDLDQALITLTKPGQLSTPIKTKYGYEILKLIAYKPAQIKPYDMVAPVIREQLQTDLAQTRYTQALEQLSDISYQTPDSLEPVASALKLPVLQTQAFSKEGTKSGVTSYKAFVNAAFSHDVLELSNNSEPVQVENDSVVVLRVRKHDPQSIKPLADVKEQIAQLITQQKAQALAMQRGKEWMQHSISPASMKNSNYQWQQVSGATRETDKAAVAINDMAFTLAKAGNETGDSLENGDFVIVQLKTIHNGKLDTLDDEQVSSITQQIEATYGVIDYDLFANTQMKKAKIQ